jgi:hypothetical protein
LTVGVPGGDTSIDAVESVETDSPDKGMYDLSGRPVKNPKAGIYIVGGKKTIVR